MSFCRIRTKTNIDFMQNREIKKIFSDIQRFPIDFLRFLPLLQKHVCNRSMKKSLLFSSRRNIQKRIAYSRSHIASALSAPCNYTRYTAFDYELLGLHHVHKSHRNTDYQAWHKAACVDMLTQSDKHSSILARRIP